MKLQKLLKSWILQFSKIHIIINKICLFCDANLIEFYIYLVEASNILYLQDLFYLFYKVAKPAKKSDFVI